jgi:formylglycine-generating enzyme required for sulfatase activity
MVYVDGTYCTEWQRRCVKSENEQSNHLTICHRFAEEQSCVGTQRRQRFCIDRYEYPSRKGAHPPVMVSAYDAAALCAEQGKRLCWESEWITACEGPRGLPFPYGHSRDNTKCNIDRPWRRPALKKVHSSNRAVQAPELARLDQSVRSGAMETCQSEYGVFDLTGNQDEWVLTETKRGTSEWVGLKGGNWHHVRNACRPMTTSHAAQWSYYFVSFRCCKDPAPERVEPTGASDGKPALWTPPPAPTPPPPMGGKLHRGWTPDGS